MLSQVASNREMPTGHRSVSTGRIPSPRLARGGRHTLSYVCPEAAAVVFDCLVTNDDAPVR
jgi:hypothetical protein